MHVSHPAIWSTHTSNGANPQLHNNNPNNNRDNTINNNNDNTTNNNHTNNHPNNTTNNSPNVHQPPTNQLDDTGPPTLNPNPNLNLVTNPPKCPTHNFNTSICQTPKYNTLKKEHMSNPLYEPINISPHPRH